jgi:hypothetical protein
VIWLAVVLLVGTRVSAEDAASPHEMIGKDGQADVTKCNVCHNDDLTLTLPKSDTCTLCHATTLHAGAQEHLNADPARVARVVPPPKEGSVALPLADDGHIYCGTCHIFHDPRVNAEKALDANWAPSGRLAQSVQDALAKQLDTMARAGGQNTPAFKFGHGTTRLRLPVADGSLCRQCHAYQK